jgi:hypothetical protein
VLALVVTLTLAQTPVALVQSSNFGVPARRTAELTHALSELLKLQGFTPVEASRPCENRACVLAVAKELKSTAVMSLAFALVGKDTLLDVEALQLSDEKSIAQATFKVPAGSSLPAIETTQFLVTFKAALPSDVPKQATVVPEPKKSEPVAPVEVTQAPPPSAASHLSPAPGIALGVAAVVAGAVSLGFLGAGIGDEQGPRGTEFPVTNDPKMHTTLTQPQWQMYVDSANSNYTWSGVLGGVAGALAVAAVVLLIYALQ